MEYNKGSVVYVESGIIFKKYKKHRIVAKLTEEYVNYYGHVREKISGYLVIEEGGEKIKLVNPNKIMGEA